MCAWITLDKPSREHIFLHFLCHRKGISLAARKGFNSSRKYRNDKNVLMTHLFCSVCQSCLTLCNLMDCSMPGFPVHHLFPELAETHVHWVGDASHFILCSPLLFLPSVFPSIGIFSNESVLHIRSPKYWSLSFSISPSNEYSGVICFRIDWLDLLAVQGDSNEFCPGGTRWQEELVDVLENIFLHGYIRNTPSDTEVHAEYQLRVDRSTWPAEKNI